MKNARYICIYLLFFFFKTISGQNIFQWPYQHIDKKAGLSNSAITEIYMDRNDIMWFGSWDGLNNYDGTSINYFKPDKLKKGSISNNIIRELHEDKNGNLWIVTHSGINRFNPGNSSFIPYFENNNIPFQEYNLKACTDPDSDLWIAINGYGISKYSAKSGSFKPYKFSNTEPEWLTSVIGLGLVGEYLFVLGQHGHLVCINNNKIEFEFNVYPGDILQQNKFLWLNDNYYLAVPTVNSGLTLYNLTNKEHAKTHLQTGASRVSCLSMNLKCNALWLGTESGNMYKITEQKGKFKIDTEDSYIPILSQKKLKILSIKETKQDILWVGTDGDGIYKFLTKERPFYPIISGQPELGQLSQSIVRCIYEDGENLYVGTRGGGLNIVNTYNTKATRIYDTNSGLSDNAVLSVNRDQKGNIWVGIDNEGIDMIEANTKKLFHFPKDFVNGNNKSFASVYSICVDFNNDLWLGTSGYGVIHLKIRKLNNGKYELVDYQNFDSRNSIMTSNIVYSVIEEKPNIFWFGSRLGGLYKYDALVKKFVNFKELSSKNLGLSDNDILCLLKDSKNNLWIGTSGGLNCLNLNSPDYHAISYTQYDGLPNNTIHGILEDKNGELWISTNNGLSLLNARDHTFKNFDWNDGLQNNEFTDGADFKSPLSNKLYFGGIEGIDIVYPDKLKTSVFFPKLAITVFQVHNMIIYPGDKYNLLKQPINITKEVKLNYKQNFISFHFTALDYWNKQSCEYAYYLENYDKDWININKQSFVNLVNIPPGKYKFHLKNTNENGIWNPEIRTISLTVTPPFWATPLAYLVYIILFFLILLAIYVSIRNRILLRKTIAIEKIKREHEDELNNYKVQFFINIAHEFRTPLTLIMGPAVTLLKRNCDEYITKPLKTIYKNSLRFQKLIQELIEFRKIETGRAKLEVSKCDLNDFTLNIVSIFQEYAVERGIEMIFIPSFYPAFGYIDSNKVEKILINLNFKCN